MLNRRIHYTLLGALLIVVLMPRNLSAWDFHAPSERETEDTPYTLGAGQKRLYFGAFGTHMETTLAALGIAYAPFRFWQIEANLLHFGAGVFNLNTKFTLVDIKRFGLGVSLGFFWVHGKWLWVLPDWQRELVQGIDIFVIPLCLTAGVDLHRMVHFDLVIGYDHVESTGYYSGPRVFLDGYLGARQIFLRPVLRLYLIDRLSLSVSGKLPMWGQVSSEVDSKVTITPGLEGGIRSANRVNLDPLFYWLVAVGLKAEVVKSFYLGFEASIGPYAEKLYHRQLSIGFDLEWRF